MALLMAFSWRAPLILTAVMTRHFRLVQLRRSELLLMSVHTQPPHQALQELASSQRPFERWLHCQLEGLLGWNV